MLNDRASSFLKTILPVIGLLLLLQVSALASNELKVWMRSLDAWPLAIEIARSVMVFTMISLPFILAEWVWPGTAARRNYGNAAKFWFFNLVFNYFWAKVAVFGMKSMGVTPLFHWDFRGDPDGVISTAVIASGIFLSIWIRDFFYYWFHRAQHRFKLLWRFHQVHHSIETLNCLNSYHHPFENVFRRPFVGLPLALLVTIDVSQLVLLSAFVSSWALFIHSDTRVNLGKLGSVFADNVYHRIHHSKNPKHFDKNFAAFLPFWDMLFGTYVKGTLDNTPAVGLANQQQPDTFKDFLLMPVRPLAPSGAVATVPQSSGNTEA